MTPGLPDPGGRPICDRQGAAVDFLVRDEDMRQVMMWISGNCRFDRMYLYAADRPLHVSVGPQNSRVIYEMVKMRLRQVPRLIKGNENCVAGAFDTRRGDRYRGDAPYSHKREPRA